KQRGFFCHVNWMLQTHQAKGKSPVTSTSTAKMFRGRTELEMEISRVMIHFEKDFMGRGPVETRTHVLDDIILVRLKGVLTPAEQRLAKNRNDRSQYLLKQVRNELLAGGRPLLETMIQDIVGIEVRSIHTDISTKTGERVILFTLERKIDCFGDDQ